MVTLLAQPALQRKLMSDDLRVDEWAGVEDEYDRCISLVRMARLPGTSERLIICSIQASLDRAISTAWCDGSSREKQSENSDRQRSRTKYSRATKREVDAGLSCKLDRGRSRVM